VARGIILKFLTC